MIKVTVRIDDTTVHVEKEDATSWQEVLKMLKKALTQASKTEVKKKLIEKGLIEK